MAVNIDAASFSRFTGYLPHAARVGRRSLRMEDLGVDSRRIWRIFDRSRLLSWVKDILVNKNEWNNKVKAQKYFVNEIKMSAFKKKKN